MSSTYSTNLAIELIGAGDQAGNWGSTTNTNLGTLLEQAISGYTTQICTGGTDTLAMTNGASATARNMFIELTTTGGGTLVVPSNKKLYFIYNNTSSAITVKVSGQTGVSVPAAAKIVLVSNGTDIVTATNYMVSATLPSATLSSPTMTGTPIAPTASPGTNTTQIATTAFVTAATGTLGTMSTQNANAVAITGGTVGGITSLGVSGTATATTFSGAGTSLTGTAAALSIGGNAATATSATSATTATTATTAAGPSASGNFLGNNQSYVSYGSGDRAYATSYTNSTSKPIFVSVFGGGNTQMDAYVNGALIQQSIFTTGATNTNVAFIVPVGNTYQVNIGSGGVPRLWTELR
jgi:hypothetical protein